MLSTHIMQEVEAICDRVIIIDKGIMVADEEKGKIHSLLKSTKQIVEVEFDKDPGLKLLSEIEGADNFRQLQENIWLIEATGSEDIRPVIFNFSVKNNLTVLSLTKRRVTLRRFSDSLPASHRLSDLLLNLP